MVPMRAIFEWLGCAVQFYPENNGIRARGAGKTIEMWLGNDQARVDGRIVALDAAPRELDGNTYVPLRFVGESMGAEVQWTESTKSATVKYGGKMGIMRVGQRGILSMACN